MTRLILVLSLLILPATGAADPLSGNRETIKRGVQAVLTCNGLFTSHRSLEQVFAQELAYMGPHIGTAQGGDYRVHEALGAVEIGSADNPPVMRAAFREGIGCVVMAPGQTLDDIDSLPSIDRPAPSVDPTLLPWPQGEKIDPRPLPATIDPQALQAASDWAFDRDTPEQVTLSLLVVHGGHIVHERYAPGVNRQTRTRTWSTAKSIAVTLIGMLADRGQLELDAPLPIDWLPELPAPETDPRRAITLRHVLNMSSGLYPVDSFGMEYLDGSGLAYWAGANSADGARQRGLVREPGSTWDYENYDTLLAVYAMRQALGSDAAYHRFPHEALLGKIGMHSTLLSTDRFGHFILSSQVYTNARDLARFGLLYLNDGRWDGEQIVSPEWIEFVRTPAPASAVRGHDYGGQWWLVPDDRDDVPRDAYATAGNRGQYVIVAPSHNTVIVRRGLDYGEQGFNRWDLAREVLKAIAPD